MTDFEEIERRFIVDGRDKKPWREDSTSSQIQQFYFGKRAMRVKGNILMMEDVVLASLTSQELDVWNSRTDWNGRLRVRDGLNIITCKSRKSKDTAFELEWAVGPEIGAAITSLGPYPSVEKTRYVWTGVDGKEWEVDEFEGRLAGVILAEIELVSADEFVEIPNWIGHEITGLPSWSNRSLADTIGN